MTIYEDAKQQNLQEILSSDRFSRYLDWAEQDEILAFEVYAWNTNLSESLYTSLQVLEISLRNRINAVLSASYSDHWFEQVNVVSNKSQQNNIKKTQQDFKKKKIQYKPGDVIASQTFGFWGTFLNHT